MDEIGQAIVASLRRAGAMESAKILESTFSQKSKEANDCGSGSGSGSDSDTLETAFTRDSNQEKNDCGSDFDSDYGCGYGSGYDNDEGGDGICKAKQGKRNKEEKRAGQGQGQGHGHGGDDYKKISAWRTKILEKRRKTVNPKQSKRSLFAQQQPQQKAQPQPQPKVAKAKPLSQKHDEKQHAKAGAATSAPCFTQTKTQHTTKTKTNERGTPIFLDECRSFLQECADQGLCFRGVPISRLLGTWKMRGLASSMGKTAVRALARFTPDWISGDIDFHGNELIDIIIEEEAGSIKEQIRQIQVGVQGMLTVANETVRYLAEKKIAASSPSEQNAADKVKPASDQDKKAAPAAEKPDTEVVFQASLDAMELMFARGPLSHRVPISTSASASESASAYHSPSTPVHPSVLKVLREEHLHAMERFAKLCRRAVLLSTKPE
jgi:hypothetical protein